MYEQRFIGNIFQYARDNTSITNPCIVITTNGVVKQDGKLVMGAGIAKYARDNLSDMSNRHQYPSIDIALGKIVSCRGKHSYFLGNWYDKNTNQVFGIISCPTKKMIGEMIQIFHSLKNHVRK